jgi:hypothetical protein
MPYGNLLADVVQSSVTGTPPQFNDGNGTQTGTLCRAWVNFNGTSGASPVIRASFNVSSVTRISTGIYTITFTSAMTDANYAAVLTTCRENAENDIRAIDIDLNGTYGTTSFRVCTLVGTSTATDRSVITASIFR